MGLITATAVLMVGMVSAAAPGPEEIAVREGVVEALREAVGDHSAPLEVIVRTLDQDKADGLPVHQFVDAEGEPTFAVSVGSEPTHSVMSRIDARGAAAGWVSSERRGSLIQVWRDQHLGIQTVYLRPTRSTLRVLDQIAEPHVADDHPLAMTEALATIICESGAESHAELITTVTLESFRDACRNASDRDFAVHALAYHEAAMLRHQIDKTGVPVIACELPSGRFVYLLPEDHRNCCLRTDGDVAFKAALWCDGDPVAVEITLINDVEDVEEIADRALVAAHTAEQMAGRVVNPSSVEGETPSP